MISRDRAHIDRERHRVVRINVVACSRAAVFLKLVMNHLKMSEASALRFVVERLDQEHRLTPCTKPPQGGTFNGTV